MKQVCLVMALIGLVVSGQAERPNPNVVLILVDDLGWQDLKCYDLDEPCAYDTPYLDAFAKKGVMFRQAYSPAPSCSPSRCAILSGNHPARAQKTHVLGGSPPAAGRSPMMVPWYSGRMPEDTFTLARAMKANGYVTGHAGKWHIAINHKAFPQPEDVGFDYTRSNRGAHSLRGMEDRLSGFATKAGNDPYRLDENGFPFHQNNEDALTFLRRNKEKPFFLYYCTWLVHSPLVTRNEALLNKYAERMGVQPALKDEKGMKGQKNPFYGAMVESLDYYVGQVIAYLENTEDPRWPGHKLSENTYIIFTSDNGGVTKYTDNAPLKLGKTSAMEGGVRVPLMIAGPGIPAGVQTDVMANGLDFYPTFLSLIGAKRPKDKNLDGCDLAPLLLGDPTDAGLVRHADGSVRDTMLWHFPHGDEKESTIRIGDYKLVRNNDHEINPSSPGLELYRLYENKEGLQQRVDIGEVKNLAEAMPEKVQQMNRRLSEMLAEMDAGFMRYNPDAADDLPNKKLVPAIAEVKEENGKVRIRYKENGAQVVRAQLVYSLNGGGEYEEWFRMLMAPAGNSAFAAVLPEGTTHYFVNLIDENNFLVSYPSLKDYRRRKTPYTGFALQPEATDKP